MTARPEVMERQGAERAAMALERQRFDASQALAENRRAFDIADLTEQQFQDLLKREQLRLTRLRQIIKNDLVAGKDYGILPGTDKPSGWEGAADKINMRMRWTPRPLGEPHIIRTGDRLMVTMTVGVFNNMDQLVGSATRSCSTKEKRFRRKGLDKWKFEDPDETLNECVAMTFKRGKLAATFSAAGIKGDFAEEEVEDEGEVSEPWSDDERKGWAVTAMKAGIPKEGLTAFVGQVLGGPRVPRKTDLPALSAAVAAYRKPGTKEAAAGEEAGVTFDEAPAGEDPAE